MKTVVAILKNKHLDLSKGADCVNNGRTDNTYFYVNGDSITVWDTYRKLTEEEQKKSLTWFLGKHEYDFILQ